MEEYFERWLTVKPLVKASPEVSEKVSSTLAELFCYNQVNPRNEIDRGTNHVIASVGEIVIPERRLFLAMRGRVNNVIDEGSCLHDATCYAQAFPQGKNPPYFAGVVEVSFQGKKLYAILTEDISEGRKYLVRGEGGSRFALRVREGVEEKFYLDPPELSYIIEDYAQRLFEARLMLEGKL